MNKAKSIDNLISAREKLIALAQTLPDEKRDEIFLGVWSVKDLLAHLVGWDFANIDSVKEIRQGKPPNIFQYWNPDWAGYNARLVEQYKRADWNELLNEIQSSHHDLIEFLKTLPADDFEKDFGVRSPRGRVITVGDHLQAEIDDEETHYQQMMDWLGNNGMADRISQVNASEDD